LRKVNKIDFLGQLCKKKTAIMSYDHLYSQMLGLLVKVMDFNDREEFGAQVLAAWTAKDEKEMLQIIDAMNAHLDAKKQSGFAYFYRYNYREIDREVKAKNPERQARDVTNELFLLWASLTKEEQKEWADSAAALE